MSRRRKTRIQEIDVVINDGKVLSITITYDRYLNELISIDILYNSFRLRRCHYLDEVPKNYRYTVNNMIKKMLDTF